VELDRARASDSRFGPRRAVQRLVLQRTLRVNVGEQHRVSPDIGLHAVYSSRVPIIINVVAELCGAGC
jgi:hypothetical protein